MSTQHLTVSVTLYSDGEWSLALLRSTVTPGQPVRQDQLITRKTDLEHVRRDVAGALQRMIESELIRVKSEARGPESTPASGPRRAQH